MIILDTPATTHTEIHRPKYEFKNNLFVFPDNKVGHFSTFSIKLFDIKGFWVRGRGLYHDVRIQKELVGPTLRGKSNTNNNITICSFKKLFFFYRQRHTVLL